MSLYMYHVGANVETMANLGHRASGPRVRILLQNQHKSTGVILKNRWPHFWLFQSMIFFFNLDCSLWFMSVPVDGCYVDSFQQPLN